VDISAGAQFDGWTGCDNNPAPTSTYCEVRATGDKAVTAHFSRAALAVARIQLSNNPCTTNANCQTPPAISGVGGVGGGAAGGSEANVAQRPFNTPDPCGTGCASRYVRDGGSAHAGAYDDPYHLWRFDGWTGACTTSDIDACTFTASRDTDNEAVAHFTYVG